MLLSPTIKLKAYLGNIADLVPNHNQVAIFLLVVVVVVGVMSCLQFVKDATFVKYNKAKHNKPRYVCMLARTAPNTLLYSNRDWVKVYSILKCKMSPCSPPAEGKGNLILMKDSFSFVFSHVERNRDTYGCLV